MFQKEINILVVRKGLYEQLCIVLLKIPAAKTTAKSTKLVLYQEFFWEFFLILIHLTFRTTVYDNFFGGGNDGEIFVGRLPLK